MRRAPVRFALETVFLVGVALAVALADASAPVITATMAVAWAAVAAVEWRVRRDEPRAEIPERAKRLQWAGTALWVAALPFLGFSFSDGRRALWLVYLTLWLAGVACHVASRRANR